MIPLAAAAGLALATLASEDLACVAAGVLVARGDLPFAWAVAGCFVGIWVGDFALALVGHVVGPPVLRRAPFRRYATPAALARAEAWFARHGDLAILAARFLPGTRVVTFVAAGVLKHGLVRVAAVLFVGCVLWVPLLVGGAARAARAGGESSPWLTGLAALAALGILRLAIAALTHRGRRGLVGFWKRWTRWEFWPRWAFYPPIVLYIVGLGLRYRSPLLFTACNPAIPGGGLVGESKAAILHALEAGGGPVARFRLLPARASRDERLAMARRFVGDVAGGFPVVLKPDVGERGTGVVIARDGEGLEAAIDRASCDLLIQEHVEGAEVGIFYARRPSEPRGRIISIVRKRLPFLEADGRRTVERLILDDPRAVAMAPFQLERLASRLDEVPAAGETVPLAEIGNHCRGALFLEGADLLTQELEEAVDRIAKSFPGFFFGRFDLRAPSEGDIAAGRGLRVLELNGVASEVAHVYDPRYGLFHAWSALADQWRLAFEVARENVAKGVRPTPWAEMARLVLRRSRPVAAASPSPARNLP